MTTSSQASYNAGDYPPNNFGFSNNFYSRPWHDCTGTGCLECAKLYGNSVITTIPGNTYIPNQGWNLHTCQGNPCTICGMQQYGQGGWGNGTTTTTNMIQCEKCGILYFAGCFHQCSGAELEAVKLELTKLKEEAEQLKKTLQRYKDLLEEFKLAIEAEQE